MSNVILGIIGVVFFIGVTLAGASYFGPKVTTASRQAQANLVMQSLAQISNAVVTRNRERELTTASSFALGDLAPTYLPELPINPFGGSVFIVDQNGDQAGPGAFIGMKIEGSSGPEICNEISRQSGGSVVAGSLSWPSIDQALGCAKATSDVGTVIKAGDLIAFAAID